MRAAVLVLVTLQASAVALRAEEAPSRSYVHPQTGLSFPGKMAGMPRGRETDFEEKTPGLGVSVGYNGPGITVTVYLYTLNVKPIPDGPESQVAQRVFDMAARDIGAMERAGHYLKVKELFRGKVALGSRPGARKALYAHFSYTQRGTQRLSRLYVTAVRGHFLKIRFSYDVAVKEAAERKLAAFLADMDKVLQAGSPAPDPARN